ncbi:NAD(P)H-dependent oxidoreductase [Pedobacter sp. MC2016-14]|uniref:NAD(P)H-dependent oxidoreductase n=1 Tax=Pedobacter sp. MC2016-14 TaxID=2897327 RepID=UPI001E5A4B39|nr:NAD(P)H-dependent oxidoreductase [Pedobacter sp. MC2016-14]MCD0486768.1 NAD(P)H-dependent oxidoreductase [Pedobacter sp. MC2016-14]
MEFQEALNWRYATKKMNGTVVPQQKVEQIVEAARLAPTSSGLQPFRVIVVTDPELKAKIQPIAFGQTQIADCSHLLIFAAWDTYTEERIRGVFANNNHERGLPDETPSDYEIQLTANYTSKTKEENFHHAAKQAYIGFGMAIAQAALLEVDATPMEGFNPAELDSLLGLSERGLRSVTLLPLGYRDPAGDWLVNLKKVRTPSDKFIIEFK